MTEFTEFTDSEIELLREIFTDNAIYEYIDYNDGYCPYKALWEKVMGEAYED